MIFRILPLLLFTFYSLSAQKTYIPSGDFESWEINTTMAGNAHEQPLNWQIDDCYKHKDSTNWSCKIPGKKTTDSYGGSNALKINPVNGWATVGLKYGGSVGGNIAGDFNNIGSLFSDSPDTIYMYVKSSLTGDALWEIGVSLINSDGWRAKGILDTIQTSNSNYTKIALPLNLYSDTVTVQRMSFIVDYEKRGTGTDDDFLIIDDVHYYKDVVTSSDSKLSGGLKVKVYPNPSTSLLNITTGVDNGNNSEVKIYSTSGLLIQSNNVSTGFGQVDVSSLSAGTYFINITSDEGFVHTEKFVKE